MTDFIGERFGKLEVICELPSVRDNSGSLRRWLIVKCDCGNVVDKKLKYLKNGDTTSCGNCAYPVVDSSAKGNPIVSLEPLADEISMVGKTYQQWTVIDVGFRFATHRMVKAVCSCGTEKYVNKRALTTKHSHSCGCYSRARTSEVMSTHGMTESRPYRIWANMRTRCNNPNTEAFHNYGGRGITHQDSWESFDAFWADMGTTYVEGLELDRIDVNGNYEVANCRWVDGSLQAYNQRKNSNNKSGKTGVSFNKLGDTWVASININKQKIHLGNFNDKDDAIEARKQAEIKYYGELKGH